MDLKSIIDQNNKARVGRQVHANPTAKIAIDNVRVFDGHALSEPRTVVIDQGIIGTDSDGAEHIDGNGGTLLPGFIDTHCHPANITHLEDLTRYGVTTAFQMACFVPAMCASLQNHPGLVNLLNASAPASAPGSASGNLTAMIDPSLLISDLSEVPSWMERQLAASPDCVKLIAELPGLSQEVLNALTSAAHEHGKMVAVHAVTSESFSQAITTGCDHIQHSTLDKPIAECMARDILRRAQTVTPTLTMMRSAAANHPDKYSYEPARESVAILHRAGVPILVGTDGNMQPGVPAAVPFGVSVHDEMDNLVEAGMSSLEALRAATVLPALHYGLRDRGRVAPGLRADLILVEGDPVEDIKAARNIKRVWVGGLEFSVAG